MSAVRAKLGGVEIDLLPDMKRATAVSVGAWLGYRDHRNVFRLARKAKVHNDDRSVAATDTDRLGTRRQVAYTLRVLPTLAGHADTVQAKTIRQVLLREAETNIAAGRPAFSLVLLAQDALLECHARVEELRDAAPKGNERDALTDVLDGLDEQAEVLEVLRSGHYRRGVSIPMGGRQVDRSAAGRKAAGVQAAKAFARLLGAAERKGS